MLLFEVFLIGCVVARVYGDECHVAEAIKCTKLFRPFPIIKGMHETEDDIDWECTAQDLFYRCLMKVIPFCNPGSRSAVPKDMASAINTLTQLCQPGSELRERYLSYSPCMNKQDTRFCEHKRLLKFEMYGITSEDFHEATFSRFCVKAHLTKTCSKEAGELYWELVYSLYPVIDPLTQDPVLISHRSAAHANQYVRSYHNPWRSFQATLLEEDVDVQDQTCDKESGTCDMAKEEQKTLLADYIPDEEIKTVDVPDTVNGGHKEPTVVKFAEVDPVISDETLKHEQKPFEKLQITKIVIDGRNEKKSKISLGHS